MKVDLWRRCATRYLLPQLPGTWGTTGALLFQEPQGWILRCVVMQTTRVKEHFKLGQHIQLLAVPSQHLVGPLSKPLDRAGRSNFWQSPDNVADAGPEMADIAAAILEQAVPYFNEHGSPEGFQRQLEALATQSPLDVHYQEAVFCLRLINGDNDGALQAATDVANATAQESAGWAREAARRVAAVAGQLRSDPAAALASLRAQADVTREHLRLPPSP
jgi:hypothetical protein